jgi:hypothetical protein
MIGVVTFTRSRYGAQTNVGGVPTWAAPIEVAIRGSIQPVTGHDLEQLPEGDRSRGVLKVYSYGELLTAEPGGAPSDRVTYGGTTYLVYQSQAWPGVGGIPRHWRAILVRLQEDEAYVPPEEP